MKERSPRLVQVLGISHVATWMVEVADGQWLTVVRQLLRWQVQCLVQQYGYLKFNTLKSLPVRMRIVYKLAWRSTSACMDWRLRTWLLTVCLWRLCQADDMSDLLSPAASLSPGRWPIWAVGTLQSLDPKYVDLRLFSRSLRTFGHKLKHYLFMSEPWAHLRFFLGRAI